MLAYNYFCETSTGYTSFIMFGNDVCEIDYYARMQRDCINGKTLFRGNICRRGVASGSCHYDNAQNWIPNFLTANNYVKV